MPTRIPAKYLNEFMTNPRLKGFRPNGTRPADLALMKQIIQETLSKPAVLEGLANYALKQGQLKIR